MELKCHSHSLIGILSIILLLAATNTPTSQAICVPRNRTGHSNPPPAETEPATPSWPPSSAPSPSTTSYQPNYNAPLPSPESEPATLAPSSAPSPSTSTFHPTPDADTNYDDSPQPASSPASYDDHDPPSQLAASPCSLPSVEPPSTTSFDTANNDATAPASASSAEPPSTSFDTGSNKYASSDPLSGLGGSLYAKQQPFRIPKLSPANPSLKKLCADTDYPALCVASLSPFLLSGRVDAAAALEVAMKATAQHARLGASAAARLAKASSAAGDEETAAALSTCKDIYGDALEDLQSAADAMASRDAGTINTMLSAVVTDSETCEDGFMGGESPLFNYNDKLRKMASNCLAIASSIN